jgi:hypothetical protein
MRLYQRKSKWPRTVIITSLALALVILLSVALLNQAGKRVGAEQLTTLENALRRASVTCYALEGRYPATLEYLAENYGVVIDEERFIVSYSTFGRNIMPDIEVRPIGGSGDKGDEGNGGRIEDAF